MLLGNNLVWKLQLSYVGLLVEVSISLGIACYCFYTISIDFINIVFLLNEIFNFFCKPRGGLCHQRLMFRVE